jgi:hypothetical protein
VGLFVAAVDVGLPSELQSDAILEGEGELLNGHGMKENDNRRLEQEIINICYYY